MQEGWSAQQDHRPQRAASAGQLLLALDCAFGRELSLVGAVASVVRRGNVERFLANLCRGLFEARKYTLYDHVPEHYARASQLPQLRGTTELGSDF